MANMFENARAFNQDLSGWNVSVVTIFRSMFFGASSFQQDLCAWGESFLTMNASNSNGSIVAGNTIEDTEARGGGTGQNGNAVNVFRAAGVIVRGNTIRRAAFTAVRGNAASHIQIVGNQCFTLGEVAIYSEFDFIDATIADNLVDGAALGVAVTNFDVGGRGAVVRNNIIRNIVNKRPQGGPDSAGSGGSRQELSAPG